MTLTAHITISAGQVAPIEPDYSAWVGYGDTAGNFAIVYRIVQVG